MEKKQEKKIEVERIREYRKQFFKNNHINMIIAMIGFFAIAVINIGMAFVLQMILDVATDGTVNDLLQVLLGTLIFLGVMFIFLLIKRVFYNRFMQKAISQYKNFVFGNILNKSINSFHCESSSAYLSAFSNDLASIESNYLAGNMNIIYQITLMIGGLIAMAYLNWKLLICVILTSSFSVLISIVFSKKLTNVETQVSNKNAAFLAMTKDFLTGFAVIKSFKAEQEMHSIFKTTNGELEKIKRSRRDTADMINILTNMSSFLVIVAIFGLGGYLAIKQYITIGVVVAFIELINHVVGPIQELGPLVANKKAAEALIIKLQQATDNSEVLLGSKEKNLLEDGISYRNVSFGYEEGKKNIQNINVTFKKGKSYAIVGGSGSGKSTLINMMLGYHSNYEGEILFDKTELREISANSLYDLVSIIQQNVFVFDNSIIDNISMFKKFDHKKMQNAIERAGLSNFMMEKGDSYKCGENGSNLSGGEKQRISIARSLIRNAPVLLMDEATAALDNTTSHMVEEAILGINDLTRIIVTHKMDEHLLSLYDEIIVMNNGVISERGSFYELMKQKGYFYSLFHVATVA